jgi:hypothetical protein
MADKVNVMKIAAILVFFAVLVGAAAAQEEGGLGGGTLAWDYIYVDADHGNDDNEGKTPGTAFATIKKGISTASDGDVIRVFPGLYQEEVDFRGKAIAVQGVAAGAAGVPVLQNTNDFAVSFYNGEGPGSILRNFVIKDNFMAVFIAGSSPTISNLTIVDNMYGIEASADSDPDISNIIFWNNTYSDLFGCRARYSRVDEVSAGQGNIDGDPLFVDPENGDYHLRSERGRYWPEHDVWVLDRLTSPCIDGGDPNAEPLIELQPNGGRINMGAYGGTAQASLSPIDQYLPGQALNPNPANGAVDVDTDVILSWSPGANAESHNVYFGTELEFRSGMERPEFSELPFSRTFVSNQTSTQFDPAGRLDKNTTYFWRIDEVNSNGTRTGVLWSFTTGTGGGPTPPPKGRACFVAETDVWVDGTLVSISKAGARRSVGRIDGAPAENSSTTLPYLGKVEELQEHEGTFECYDVLLESGNSIGVAGNHYFLTESSDWVAVQNLKPGTKLQTPNGTIGVVSVTKRPTPYVGKVYNLKVEGSGRYLVGKDAVIVRDY